MNCKNVFIKSINFKIIIFYNIVYVLVFNYDVATSEQFAYDEAPPRPVNQMR